MIERNNSYPICRNTGNQFPFCESSSAGLEINEVDPFADFCRVWTERATSLWI